MPPGSAAGSRPTLPWYDFPPGQEAANARGRITQTNMGCFALNSILRLEAGTRFLASCRGWGGARVGRAFYPTNFDDVAEKLWLNLKNLTLQSQDVCLTRRFI